MKVERSWTPEPRRGPWGSKHEPPHGITNRPSSALPKRAASVDVFSEVQPSISRGGSVLSPEFKARGLLWTRQKSDSSGDWLRTFKHGQEVTPIAIQNIQIHLELPTRVNESWSESGTGRFHHRDSASVLSWHSQAHRNPRSPVLQKSFASAGTPERSTETIGSRSARSTIEESRFRMHHNITTEHHHDGGLFEESKASINSSAAHDEGAPASDGVHSPQVQLHRAQLRPRTSSPVRDRSSGPSAHTDHPAMARPRTSSPGRRRLHEYDTLRTHSHIRSVRKSASVEVCACDWESICP
jgi:hypothetical protein